MEHRGVEAIEAVARRERQPYFTIAVRPLSPVIGAEVEGLDLSLELSPDQRAELRRAYLEHHVLVFRDQLISEADHNRLALVFGLPADSGRLPVTRPAGDAREEEPVMLAESWRADETYRPDPPAGGLLHIHKLPKLGAGGDMLFANMHLAYDLLSQPLKALLDGLSAIHVPDPGERQLKQDNRTAEHPVINLHPVTGRPAIFVNRRHTSHIAQLEPGHGRDTLEMLCRHLETHPVITCRVRWTPNTLVVWDNRSTQHLTLQDFRPGCLSGHLISIMSDFRAA